METVVVKKSTVRGAGPRFQRSLEEACLACCSAWNQLWNCTQDSCDNDG